jgi:hypothetical protein
MIEPCYFIVSAMKYHERALIQCDSHAHAAPFTRVINERYDAEWWAIVE